VAVFAGFPPFVHWQDGKLAGREIDLLNKFAASEGWTPHFTVLPFDGLWDRPGDDEFDIAAAGLSKSGQRDAIWAEPHAEVRRAALVPSRNTARLRDYDSMRRFAAVPGSAAYLHALKHLPRGRELVAIHSIEEGVGLLRNDVVDAVGTGSVSAAYQVRHQPGLASVDLHRSADRVEEIAFAARNNPLLLHKINRFVLDLKTPQI
jgi:ABC-type amino acid transport substrate-binding protein